MRFLVRTFAIRSRRDFWLKVPVFIFFYSVAGLPFEEKMDGPIQLEEQLI